MPYSAHDLETFNGNWEPPPDNPNYPGVGRMRAPLRAPETTRPAVLGGPGPMQGAFPGMGAQQGGGFFAGLFRRPEVAPTLPNAGPIAQAFPRLAQMQANQLSRRAQFATNHPILGNLMSIGGGMGGGFLGSLFGRGG